MPNFPNRSSRASRPLPISLASAAPITSALTAGAIHAAQRRRDRSRNPHRLHRRCVRCADRRPPLPRRDARVQGDRHPSRRRRPQPRPRLHRGAGTGPCQGGPGGRVRKPHGKGPGARKRPGFGSPEVPDNPEVPAPAKTAEKKMTWLRLRGTPASSRGSHPFSDGRLAQLRTGLAPRPCMDAPNRTVGSGRALRVAPHAISPLEVRRTLRHDLKAPAPPIPQRLAKHPAVEAGASMARGAWGGENWGEMFFLGGSAARPTRPLSKGRHTPSPEKSST